MKRNFNAQDPRWRHKMETFSALLAHCAGNSPNPPTKTSDAEPWCFLWSAAWNKLLCRQSSGWWFETSPRPLCRHCNVFIGAGMPAPNWLHMFTTYDLFSAIPYIKFHGRTNSHMVYLHTSNLRHCIPCAEFSKNMFVSPVLWGDV